MRGRSSKLVVIPSVARNLGGGAAQECSFCRSLRPDSSLRSSSNAHVLASAFAHSIFVEEILRSLPSHRLAQDDRVITSSTAGSEKWPPRLCQSTRPAVPALQRFPKRRFQALAIGTTQRNLRAGAEKD